MKAALYDNYGPPEVLQIREVEQPLPKRNEILVKVHATQVSSGDARLRRADPFLVRLFFGLFRPRKKILGASFSGEVAATGEAVTLFRPGDEVFGMTGLALGTYAEFVCLPETGAIAKKPANISHEEAAVIPFGGTTALHFLQKAGLKAGHKILINGASGGVGTAAVQIAKSYGAEVTGVCSTANVELVKSIGADRVIDYTRKDFSLGAAQYDSIFETVGKIPVSKALAALKKGGTLLQGSAGFGETLQGMWQSLTGDKKVIAGVAIETAAQMNALKELIETGQLRGVIDRTLPLEEIAEAHRYVDTGRKKGNVAIRIAGA